MNKQLKSLIKTFLNSSYFLRTFAFASLKRYKIIKSAMGGGNKIENHGCIRIKKEIIGSNNKVVISKGCVLNHTLIVIRGNNCRLTFDENCSVGPGCSFYLEGNNVEITLGKGCSMTDYTHFAAQEHNSRIILGDDCMFAGNIEIRTSNSHPILNAQTMERIDAPQSVIIGNHVWIARHTLLLKGTHIGNNCIIGSYTVTSKQIPDNSLAVGMPAKVVKQNITWGRGAAWTV